MEPFQLFGWHMSVPNRTTGWPDRWGQDTFSAMPHGSLPPMWPYAVAIFWGEMERPIVAHTANRQAIFFACLAYSINFRFRSLIDHLERS